MVTYEAKFDELVQSLVVGHCAFEDVLPSAINMYPGIDGRVSNQVAEVSSEFVLTVRGLLHNVVRGICPAAVGVMAGRRLGSRSSGETKDF